MKLYVICCQGRKKEVKEDRGKSRMLLFKLRFMSYYAHCPFNHIIFQGSNRSRQGRSGIMGKKSIFRRNRDKTPEPLQEYFSLCILNICFFNFINIFVIQLNKCSFNFIFYNIQIVS